MNPLKYLSIGTKAIINFTICFIKYFFIGLITIITFIPNYIIIGLKFLFSKKNQTPNNKQIQKNIIPITVLTLSVTTYLLSIFILTRWYVQNERTKHFTKDLIQSTTSNNEFIELPEESKEPTNQTDQYEDPTPITPAPETPDNNQNTTPPPTQSIPTSPQQSANTNFIDVNLNYYIQKNPDTVAFLQVNGTKVNYPVVQSNDNDYYLKHDFYQRKTTNGWIFGDYRNNFETFNNNTIIYGHNLINDTMFGTIPNLLNKNWFNNKNNHYIKLSTKNTNTVWQIFSVYKTEPTTDYLQTRFKSTTTYQEFLNTIKNRSIHQFNLNLNYTDKIITLSTCDDIGTKRVAVHAKLIHIESK